MLATPMTPQSHPSPSTTMAYSLAATAPTASRPAIASRPKLTLQTSSLPRTFGTSSTGLSLSLAAGPTASPTVRNTFKNAYEVAPSSATASPSSKFPSTSTSTSTRFSKPSSPFTTHHPYQLPLGVRSILRNSPLEPSCRRRSGSVATNNGPNGGPSSRRVFFPAKKQVSYRFPLEEEIQTVRYTARHSDLHDEPVPQLLPEPSISTSDDDSDSTTSGGSSSSSSTTTSEDEPDTTRTTTVSGKTPLSPIKRKKRKHHNAERQVRAVALMDGLAGTNYGALTPQTPRRKRAKRRCEWRWTLGPLEKGETVLQDETRPSVAVAAETIPPPSETDAPASSSSTCTTTTTTYTDHHSSPSSSVPSGRDTHESQADTTHERQLLPECMMNVDHPR